MRFTRGYGSKLFVTDKGLVVFHGRAREIGIGSGGGHDGEKILGQGQHFPPVLGGP